MSGPVLVRLTDAQRGALRSLASVTVDNGEGGVALSRALEALDNAQPALAVRDLEALSSAGALLQAHAEDDPGIYGSALLRYGRLVGRLYRLAR